MPETMLGNGALYAQLAYKLHDMFTVLPGVRGEMHLHYGPVVVIGHYVVQWPTSALIKYLVIALSSLVVTLALYDIGVRRTRVTRFLFGMRDR